MTDIKTWSTSAANNNAAPPDGFPEGQPPSTVNNSAREVMAAIRRQIEAGMWFDHGITPTWQSSASFSLSSDVSNVFTAGRPLELYGSVMGTAYASVKSSTYVSPVTTITIDSSSVGSTISQVRYSLMQDSNSLPKNLKNDYTVSGALAVTGPLNVGGAATLASLNVSGNTTISGAVTLKNTLTSEIATYAKTQTMSDKIAPGFAASATASLSFSLSDSITFLQSIQVFAYDVNGVGDPGSGYNMSWSWVFDSVVGSSRLSYSGCGGNPIKFPSLASPPGPGKLAVKILNNSGGSVSGTTSVAVRVTAS